MMSDGPVPEAVKAQWRKERDSTLLRSAVDELVEEEPKETKKVETTAIFVQI